ncbi:MAG: glycosyltransferase family 39 protein [Saprospiraceae bacterium]
MSSQKSSKTKSEVSLNKPTTIPEFGPPYSLDLKSMTIAGIIFLLISFGLYYASIPFDYVLDDKIVISENTFTKKGVAGLKEIFTTESFTGYFGEKKDLVQGNRYRPLSIATFAVEYEMNGGLNPRMSHIINIIWYGLTGLLLFIVLISMIGLKQIKWYWSLPFLATVLFLVHPIHTEAVANIKGRDEIMSLFFSLFMLFSSIKFIDEGKLKWLIFASISYFLGLLSKENAITFLAVVPLSAYFFRDTTNHRLGKTMLWLGITTFIYLMLRFNTAGVPQFNQEITDLMNNPFLGMTPLEKMGSIMYTLGKYLILLIWPYPLSHDYYPYAIPKSSLFSLWPLLSLVIYGALIYFGIKKFKSKSIYSYSIWFYLFTLSIVSNIVINVGTFMNERFIFMASVGFCIAVVYFLVYHLPKMIENRGKHVGLGILSVMVIAFAALSFTRVPVWKDALSLNQAAVDVSTGSARANSFMSTALFEEFKITKDQARKTELLDKAEIYANRAVDIIPDYNNANLMLIGVVTERFKMSQDINYYVQGMKPIIMRRPDIPFIVEFSNYLKDKGFDSVLHPFYKDVGKSLLALNDKRRGWAIQYLQFAFEINPNDRDLVLTLAKAYELAGNQARAKTLYDAAKTMQ